jgi:glucose/arabinose dehydrogenase
VKVALRVFAALLALVLALVGVRHLYRDPALRAEILQKTDKHAAGVFDHVFFFPAFGGLDDELSRVDVSLTEVTRGLKQPTSISFLPPPFGSMVVLERTGRVTRIEGEGVRARWLDTEVSHQGPEEGLLDFVVHPDFGHNGRIFLSRTYQCDGQPCLLVDEYRIANPQRSVDETPALVREVLRVKVVDANRTAGVLAFGPDDMLFVGIGDGGEDAAQRKADSLLGSILRLDMSDAALPYKVPADNPSLDKEHPPTEVFARGVHMPRRLSFDRHGRLLVADHGEHEYEEVSVVLAGDDLGFPTMEGRDCGSERCRRKSYRLPFMSYPRLIGDRTTGGYVAGPAAAGMLRNLYVAADRTSGLLLGVRVPKSKNGDRIPVTMGTWPIAASAVGRDPKGAIYVADYERGRIYRIDEKRGHWSDGLRDVIDIIDHSLFL